MSPSPRLGIIVALPAEADCLCPENTVVPEQPLPLPCGELLVCGIGQQRAASAASLLIERGAGALLIWGTAAALSDDCNSGDVIIPEQVLAANHQTYTMNRKWRDWWLHKPSPVPLKTGTLFSSDSAISTVTDKQALHADSGAIAVDMESAAVAAMAEKSGLPCLCLRAIADGHRQALPAVATSAIDAFARPNLPGLIGGLCRHPGQIPDLIRLGLQFRTALKALRHIRQQNGYNLAPQDLILL